MSSGSDPLGRLRVVVLGYIVRCPLGGMAWHHLQYVMGLARLGHDVTFVEDSDDVGASCYDPRRGVTDADPTFGLEFTGRVFGRVGLGERWAYHDAHTRRWFGPAADRVVRACTLGDVLLNLSGANPVRPWLEEIPVRVYVDTDPVFTQIRNNTDPIRRERALAHTTHFSFGENIARGSARVPDDGFCWLPTRQPVVLDAWTVSPPPTGGRFTSIMQWDSYPAREHAGVRYGMKSDSIRPYLDLPTWAGPRFELALGGPGAPRSLLNEKGWTLRDPLETTRDPWTYQRYIRASHAEFGIAKHGYVVSRSGWFSERSACYLATGRPVLVQDTGFSDWLETGLGAISFTCPEEVLAGVRDIDARYERHARVARALAEEYFDSRTVLRRLLETALDARATTPPSGAAPTGSRAT